MNRVDMIQNCFILSIMSSNKYILCKYGYFTNEEKVSSQNLELEEIASPRYCNSEKSFISIRILNKKIGNS